MSSTAAGRERWDTPEIKLETGRKGRMRKDRYSALVIANMIARSIHRQAPPTTYQNIGRMAGPRQEGEDATKSMYVGPEWARNIDPRTFFAVHRKQ